MPVLLEICVDTFESAVAAIQGGADRIELCSALSEGGLTPTVGLVRQIKLYLSECATLDAKGTRKHVPVYCMIRCRRGSDFCYSEQEMNAMLWDLQALKQNGADGIVFGALEPSGRVHREHCEQIANAAEKLPLTFHRAIDCTEETQLEENLKLVAQLGYTTVLTSGLNPTAEQGVETIVRMKTIATNIEEITGTRLRVMPGSGISSANALNILQRTGCDAIHGSASIIKPMENETGATKLPMGASNVDASPLKVCSKAKVQELRSLIDSI
ncbi:copper homeostasis protein cutC homolog [Anopheles maculipalpis]|uniref:copper homeostasis protein cutC homolog n=1 Tax=Anopheles maculipalpis TaxID=1496333 RepID=UPI002158F3B5|nr:copper homeostasis protein cutC homolog [Anopheles maculipalpis]